MHSPFHLKLLSLALTWITQLSPPKATLLCSALLTDNSLHTLSYSALGAQSGRRQEQRSSPSSPQPLLLGPYAGLQHCDKLLTARFDFTFECLLCLWFACSSFSQSSSSQHLLWLPEPPLRRTISMTTSTASPIMSHAIQYMLQIFVQVTQAARV